MNDIYISRGTAVAARELAGEMIIMSAVDSTLFSLNDTASLIWRAADGRTPLSEIVELRICSEFEVLAEEAYRDAVALVEELAGHGILQLSDQPVGVGNSVRCRQWQEPCAMIFRQGEKTLRLKLRQRVWSKSKSKPSPDGSIAYGK